MPFTFNQNHFFSFHLCPTGKFLILILIFYAHVYFNYAPNYYYYTCIFYCRATPLKEKKRWKRRVERNAKEELKQKAKEEMNLIKRDRNQYMKKFKIVKTEGNRHIKTYTDENNYGRQSYFQRKPERHVTISVGHPDVRQYNKLDEPRIETTIKPLPSHRKPPPVPPPPHIRQDSVNYVTPSEKYRYHSDRERKPRFQTPAETTRFQVGLPRHRESTASRIPTVPPPDRLPEPVYARVHKRYETQESYINII